MAELPLTQGRVAVVDDADLPLVSRWKWQWLPARVGTGYAAQGRQDHDLHAPSDHGFTARSDTTKLTIVTAMD